MTGVPINKYGAQVCKFCKYYMTYKIYRSYKLYNYCCLFIIIFQ